MLFLSILRACPNYLMCSVVRAEFRILQLNLLDYYYYEHGVHTFSYRYHTKLPSIKKNKKETSDTVLHPERHYIILVWCTSVDFDSFTCYIPRLSEWLILTYPSSKCQTLKQINDVCVKLPLIKCCSRDPISSLITGLNQSSVFQIKLKLPLFILLLAKEIWINV